MAKCIGGELDGQERPVPRWPDRFGIPGYRLLSLAFIAVYVADELTAEQAMQQLLDRYEGKE